MIYIIAVYEGRKYYDIEISETNTVKEIMDICYNKINKLNKPQNERFYSKDKILVKFNDRFLNAFESGLNKTAKELGIIDDDTLTLLDTESINAGKNN